MGLAAALRKKGVLVRFFGSQGGDLNKYIRISAGRESDIDRLMEVLAEMKAQEGFPSLPGLALPEVGADLTACCPSSVACIWCSVPFVFCAWRFTDCSKVKRKPCRADDHPRL